MYSTCSLCVAQNEDVVKWLLNSYTSETGDEAYLPKVVPIDLAVSNAPGKYR